MENCKDSLQSKASTQMKAQENYQSSQSNKKHRSLFKCNICSKVFSNSSAIAKHRLTHSEERKYSCPICKKAFKRQDHLNGHKLTHETKRPHGCRFCEKSYSDSRSLRRHYENSHVEEYEKWKLVVTSLKIEDEGIEIDKEMIANCENDDASSKLVKALWMSYSLEEPKKVSCQVCGKRFKNQPALNGHMRLHGGYSLTGSSDPQGSNNSDKNPSDTGELSSDSRDKSPRITAKVKRTMKAKPMPHSNDSSTNPGSFYNGAPMSTLSDNTDTCSFEMKPLRFNSNDQYASSINSSSRSSVNRTDWPNSYDNSQANSYPSSLYNLSFEEKAVSEKDKLFHHLLTEEQRNFPQTDNTIRRRHESGFPQFSGFANPSSRHQLLNSTGNGAIDCSYNNPASSNSLQQGDYLPPMGGGVKGSGDTAPMSTSTSALNQSKQSSSIIHTVRQFQKPFSISSANNVQAESSITKPSNSVQKKPPDHHEEIKKETVYKAVAYFGNKPLPCTGPYGTHYSPVTPDVFPVETSNLKRKATDPMGRNYSKFQFDTEATETLDLSKTARFENDTVYSWNSGPIMTAETAVNNSISTNQNLVASNQPACETTQSSCLFDFKENDINAFSTRFTSLVGEVKDITGPEEKSTVEVSSQKGVCISKQNAQNLPVVAQDNWIFDKEIIEATKETFFVCSNENDTNKSQAIRIYQEDKRLPKKKRRPAPLYIHPNVTGNMSRLRTPLPPNKDKAKFLAPYTPPPMLSPNRKGSGLFYNLKKKPKSSLYRCLSECHSTDYSSENSVSNCNNNDYSKSSFRYNEKNIIKSCHYNVSQTKSGMSSAGSKAPKSAPPTKVPFSFPEEANDKAKKPATTEDLFEEKMQLEESSPNAFNFNFNEEQLENHVLTQSKGSYSNDEEDTSDDFDEADGVPTNSIPTINVGDDYQAIIPECSLGKTADEYYSNQESWEKLLWYPENFNDDDPKNKDSLDLLMKIACSAAVRNCGLNMEYAFHLLCKYKGDLEKTLQSLLRDCLVVYDYVYAETTVWSKEEIIKFQEGLNEFGRDFYLIAKEMNASGMNKTVKACVEFYYVWKRMNNPAEVKRYRTTKSKRDRQKKSNQEYCDNPQSSKLDKAEPTPPPLKTPNIDILTVGDNKTSIGYNSSAGKSSQERDSEICFELVTPQTSTASVATSVKAYNDKKSVREDQNIIMKQRSVLCEECGEILQDEHICSEWLAQAENITPNPCLSPQPQRFYPCKFCGRVFFRLKSRQNHMKLHESTSNQNNSSSLALT